MEPTQDQILQAHKPSSAAAGRRADAKAHPYRPKGIPDGLGGYEVCQHCRPGSHVIRVSTPETLEQRGRGAHRV